ADRITSADNSGDARWRPSLGDSFDELTEGDLSLADDGVVDPVERPDVLGTHLVVEVRAAEHDDHVRMVLLDRPSERQRGHVLLERRAEADHRVIPPGVPSDPLLDQGR